jgi:hypothetical protein
MGHSPPIPVDPIQSVPETVLRHIPGQAHDALGPSNPIEQQQQQAPPPMPYPIQVSQQQPSQMPSQQVPMSTFPSNQMRPPTTQGQPPTSYFPDQSIHPTNTANPQQVQQYPHGFGQPMQQSMQQPMQPMQGQPMTGQMSYQGLPSQGNAINQYGQSMQQPMMPGSQQQPRQEDPHRSDRPRTKTVPPPSAAQTRKDSHKRSHSLSVPVQSPDPGSFLDRVEHDPKLQSMLSGAPTRTVHTSNPVTASSIHTHTDKPLPDPQGRSKRTVSRRQSLMGDINHHPSAGHINSGDRYPSFPVNGSGHVKGHSRQSSFNATRSGRQNDL